MSRQSSFFIVIKSARNKIPRFLCTPITVEEFSYVCFVERSGARQTCIFVLSKLCSRVFSQSPQTSHLLQFFLVQLLEYLLCSLLPKPFARCRNCLYVIPSFILEHSITQSTNFNSRFILKICRNIVGM